MIKKTITYVDYNGNNRTEDFWFNLSKAELMAMEMETVGGFTEVTRRIIAAQDTASLIKIFKDFILKTYGEKGPDGKRFIKSKELSEAFSQTEAYSDLFMELATNAEKASEFINGVAPADLVDQVKSQMPSAVDNSDASNNNTTIE